MVAHRSTGAVGISGFKCDQNPVVFAERQLGSVACQGRLGQASFDPGLEVASGSFEQVVEQRIVRRLRHQ